MYSNSQSQKYNKATLQQIKITQNRKNNTVENFEEMRKSISIQIREIENKIKSLEQPAAN